MSYDVAVSIVMPSHNSATFIGESIKSVQAQDFRDWELLVSDDGSTDATCAVVEALHKEDPRIKLLASPIARVVSWRLFTLAAAPLSGSARWSDLSLPGGDTFASRGEWSPFHSSGSFLDSDFARFASIVAPSRRVRLVDVR